MTNSRVGADVADNGESALGGSKSLGVEEGGDSGGEVNAVDEDVGVLDDFLEWATCRRQY